MKFGWSSRGVGIIAVMLTGFAMAAEPPVVPGYTVLKASAKITPAAQGELLLGELNCVACHTPGLQSRVTAKGAPDLSEAGAHITPQYLRDYLSNPHGMKPGTTMPDIFHASAPEAKAGAVEFLVHFLVSQGGPIADPVAVMPSLVEQGKKLYESVGCLACHAPEKGPTTKISSVPLPNLAEKTTVDALTAFLIDPLHTRPAGRMPSSNLTGAEAKAIAIYLLRQQLDHTSPTSRPLPGTGVNYAYYDATFTTAALEKYLTLKPTSTGKLKGFTLDFPGIKNRDHFGVRYTGSIHIPKGGKYTFTLNSDDGTILYIDAQIVVANDGHHPTSETKSAAIQLKPGDHPIELTYFQDGGGTGLEVRWKGPGIDKKEIIPTEALAASAGKAMIPLKSEEFTLDPEKVRMGGQMFSMLGCASCHALADHPPMRPAKPLADLNPANPEGCLGDQIIKGRPKYDLSSDQRDAIIAALKNAAVFATPLDPAQKAIHEMAAMNCFACHPRDGIGGVPPDRVELFKSTVNVDLGDDGRLPPALTLVGAKLLPAAFDRLLFHGELRVRPYIATRMPAFSQEKLKDLPETFAKADIASDSNVPTLQPVADHAKDGWRLVGVKGLGCINCHGAKGAKSLGVPGPDLSFVYQRVRPQWFRRWLEDPNKLVSGTRMPAFWNEGESALKTFADGKFEPQAAAIWSYLAQGPEMQLPEGLRLDGSDEIIPTDEVVVLRAFVTGVSPRSILVGNPESIHWVFDANAMRLAKAWHGKFFDAAGIWEARGGNARPPLGKDVIDLPDGPSFAVLDSQAAPWPEPNPKNLFDRNLGGHFKGYTLDKQGRPTFKYTLNDVAIQETEFPKGSGAKAALQRHFKLSAAAPAKDLYFLVASGKKITNTAPDAWLIDDKQTIRLTSDGGAAPSTEIRDGKEGSKLLLVPVKFNNNVTEYTVEISW